MSPKLLTGKVLTGTVAAVAVLLAGSARAEVVVPNDFVTQPMYGTVVSDGTLFSNQSVSSVTAHTPPDQTTGKGGGNWVCKNFDDPNCQSQSWIGGTIILSPCSKTTEPVCIDSLSIGRDGEKLSPATLAFEAMSQKMPASPLS